MDNYVTNIYIGGAKRSASFNYAINMVEMKGEKQMLDLTISNEQKIKVSCTPVSPGGTPVGLDGPVKVEVTSGEATAEVQADGLSFYLISGANPGDTVFAISADADVGEGVETIADVINLHVEGARASSLGLVADTPELKELP